MAAQAPRRVALLGVKPFLAPGEEGDECVLKSKVEEDYVLKSTVEADACGSGTVLDASTMKCVVEGGGAPTSWRRVFTPSSNSRRPVSVAMAAAWVRTFIRSGQGGYLQSMVRGAEVAEDAAFFAGEREAAS